MASSLTRLVAAVTLAEDAEADFSPHIREGRADRGGVPADDLDSGHRFHGDVRDPAAGPEEALPGGRSRDLEAVLLTSNRGEGESDMQLSQVGTRLARRLSGRRGQNTVEYLLMLTVVVGVVLVAGVALKKFMPSLFIQIQGMITGAAGQMGSGPSN